MRGTDVHRDLGGALRYHRTRLRLTQQRLAELSSLSVRAIRDIESGCRVQPRRETVRLIADGLGLNGRERVEFESAAGRFATKDELKGACESDPISPPSPVDGLVGRNAELAVLGGSLFSGHQRLTTITGLGGVGKTRLALEVAGVLHGSKRFSVLWASADSVHPTGSRQLNDVIRTGLDGLFTTGGEPGELTTVIADRPTLLVLDGHDVTRIRADRLIRLLHGCGGLRVLITAPSRLGLRDERTFPLAPLAGPDAVRLLIDHARRVRPEFGQTTANSRHLAALSGYVDGIPAAVEALASWFAVYQPAELRELVEADPFDFLETPPADGLRERLGQALGELDAGERSLLTRLAAAETGWSVADATAMTGLRPATCARILRSLLAQGMVRPEDGTNRSRFRVLNLVRHLRTSRAAA